MSRTEFVRRYAKNSGISDEWAILGLIAPTRESRMIALPCDCGEDGCEGWAMLGIESVLHHLQFCAPDDMRDAYMKSMGERG